MSDSNAPSEVSGLMVLFVAGMSGAGRSSVANILEDDGWYVADNVPSSLVAKLVDFVHTDSPAIARMGIVVRATDSAIDDELAQVRGQLAHAGVRTRVLFLDASDQILVRRFEQVRRRHPMQGGATLIEGIARERAVLDPIRNSADQVVDTSALSIAKLRSVVEGMYPSSGDDKLSIAVQSFGFKYGLPIDSDLVADVRFLPNPYWIPELREHNGRDEPVRDYVLGQPEAEQFARTYVELVALVAPGYLREGKRYMTISIGCTGGKHRSVAMTEELAHRLAELSGDGPSGYEIRVMHRDLGRE